MCYYYLGKIAMHRGDMQLFLQYMEKCVIHYQNVIFLNSRSFQFENFYRKAMKQLQKFGVQTELIQEQLSLNYTKYRQEIYSRVPLNSEKVSRLDKRTLNLIKQENQKQIQAIQSSHLAKSVLPVVERLPTHQGTLYTLQHSRLVESSPEINQPGFESDLCKQSRLLKDLVRVEFNQVQLLSAIRKGTLGITYLAQVNNKGLYALKKIQYLEFSRFKVIQTQIKPALRVQHPNLLPLLGYSLTRSSTEETRINLYLISDLKKTNLETVLTSNFTLTRKQKLSIAFQIADACSELQKMRILHGNLKDSQVLLDKDLQV